MRKSLITLAMVVGCVVAAAATWIFCGRQLSLLVDRYWTVETAFLPIHSVGYEGSGTGGILVVNDVSLSLNDVGPGLSVSIGSTKDNQFALRAAARFSLSVRWHPRPRTAATVLLPCRLRAIMLSSRRVTAFLVGRHLI